MSHPEPGAVCAPAEALRRHVHILAGDIGERNVFRPAALDAAADYLRQQWQAMGYTVTPQGYEAHGVACTNLEVSVPGEYLPEEIVLVGAHYDTVQGSPGADDNASGVAALLEISRSLITTCPARSIRFVAFVNEEAPFFYFRDMGSLVYARAARARSDDIRLMLSLEMLGFYSDQPGSQTYPPLLRRFFPQRGNFIGFVSNLRHRRTLQRMAGAFRSVSGFPAEHAALPGWIPGVGWSDHSSFWRKGYAAVMVTDTAFHRNPFYHTALDTPEKLDYPRMAQVTTGLSAAIASLAAVVTL